MFWIGVRPTLITDIFGPAVSHNVVMGVETAKGNLAAAGNGFPGQPGQPFSGTPVPFGGAPLPRSGSPRARRGAPRPAPGGFRPATPPSTGRPR